ncbi:unnamed protein product [Polarella glacialis]|uniref:Uncharacterized protein n=1 Tax=Polarella glacialis TaxID=89957 RepID=A0A813GSK1_POLGL|nr:unnamed protein product [Polarella glacialis]CAE8733848.1 unnamed protein product [Polarella glacialis]
MPCQDNSPSGGQMYYDGRTAPIYIAWARRLKVAGTKIIILENSTEIKLIMIEFLFADEYDIHQLWVKTHDSGHSGVARFRTYLILNRRSATACNFDPEQLYKIIADRITAAVQTSPRDYICATTEEILLEAQEVARTRCIMFRPGCLDMTYLLNEREMSVVAGAEIAYFQKFGQFAVNDEDLIVFLGDNLSYSLTWSATSNAIPTYRLSTGKHWIMHLRRWMASPEKLLSLGFPIRPSVAHAMGVHVHLPIRDVKRADQLTGNCMHFSSTAIVQLIALSCFCPRDRL